MDYSAAVNEPFAVEVSFAAVASCLLEVVAAQDSP